MLRVVSIGAARGIEELLNTLTALATRSALKDVPDMQKAIILVTAWRLRGEALVLQQLVQRLMKHENKQISKAAQALHQRWNRLVVRFVEDAATALYLREVLRVTTILKGHHFKRLGAAHRHKMYVLSATPPQASVPVPAAPHKQRTRRLRFSSELPRRGSQQFKTAHESHTQKRRREIQDKEARLKQLAATMPEDTREAQAELSLSL